MLVKIQENVVYDKKYHSDLFSVDENRIDFLPTLCNVINNTVQHYYT